MKTRSANHKSIAKQNNVAKISSAKPAGTACMAYGDTVSICINADCVLRRKAGGCLGFEGCPGFKSR